MEIIKSSVKLEALTQIIKEDGSYGEGNNISNIIEKAGRTCYKSESKITNDSADKFCKMIQTMQHFSVIEHCSATFRIVCDRGVSHELVRHRLASYSQESTRYVSYLSNKKGMKFIQPSWISDEDLEKELNLKSGDPIPHEQMGVHIWYTQCEDAELRYNCLISDYNWTPQQARAILPNCLKTEIVMTANFREWLHFLELRTSNAAHPDMQVIAKMIGKELNRICPVLFGKYK